jgi:hypothetical protein
MKYDPFLPALFRLQDQIKPEITRSPENTPVNKHDSLGLEIAPDH